MRRRSDIVVVVVVLSLAACGKGSLRSDAGDTTDSSGAAGTTGSGAAGGNAGDDGGAASAGAGGGAGQAGSGGGAVVGGSGGAGGKAGASGIAGTIARGGVGGGAGSTGGAGSGGITAFEARAVATDCSAATNTIAGPILVDATITCPAGPREISVAAGVEDRGFVSLPASYEPPPGRFVTVDAKGSIAVIKGPTGAYGAKVLTDADGNPYVFANRLPGPGLGFFRLDGQGWWGEAINPALDSTTTGATLRGELGPDGRAHIVYNLAAGMLMLSTRTGANSWIQTPVPATSYISAVTVDSEQRPHVVFLSEPGVSDWIAGSTAPSLLASLADTRIPLAAASVGGGRVAASIGTVNAIAVVVQRASGPATVHTLPATPQLTIKGCPPLPLTGSMPPTPCTNSGDGILGQALAATDGALWVAYVSRHEDSDHTQACFPFENSSICQDQLVTDRSTNEVVLVRVRADGAPDAPTVVWRAPITGKPSPPGNAMAMVARGARLVLAVQSPGLTTRPNVVRYLMLDTSKL